MADLTRGSITPIDPRRLRRLGAAHTVRKMLRSITQTPFRNTPVQIGGTVGNGSGLDTDLTTFLDLTDTPDSYLGQALKAIRVNAGETALEFFFTPETFLELSDTPNTYAAQALNFVRVNAGETALEFYTLTLPTQYWGVNATPTPDILYNLDTAFDIAFGGNDDTAPFFFDVSAVTLYFGGSASSSFPRGIDDAGAALKFNCPVQIIADLSLPGSWTVGAGYINATAPPNDVSANVYGSYFEINRGFNNAIAQTFNDTYSGNFVFYGSFDIDNASTLHFGSFSNVISYLYLDDTAGSYTRGGPGVEGLLQYKARLRDSGVFFEQIVWDVESQGITRNNFCTIAATIVNGIAGTPDAWTFTFSNNCTSPDNNNPLAVVGNVIDGTAMLGMPPVAVPVKVHVHPTFDPVQSLTTQVGGEIEYTVIDAAANTEITVAYPGVGHHYNNFNVMILALTLSTTEVPQVSVLVRREYNALA